MLRRIAASPRTIDRRADALRAADTRARILHATLRVIAAGGIGAVSNRRVAAEAGVALGSLTYHFPSQTDLLRESLLLYAEEEVARLEALAAELRAGQRRRGPSAEQAAAVVEQIAARSTGPARGDRRAGAAPARLARSRAARGLAPLLRRLRGLRRRRAGGARGARAGRHARTVVALLCGLGVRRLGTGEHAAEGTADALLTVVRGRDGGLSLPRTGRAHRGPNRLRACAPSRSPS